MALIASAMGFKRAMVLSPLIHLLKAHLRRPFTEALPAEHNLVSPNQTLFAAAHQATVCATAEFFLLFSSHQLTSTW
jgi:hypothetical protein